MKLLLSLLAVCIGATNVLAQDCTSFGTSLGDGDEVVFAIQPIGFAFPLGGMTYTDVHISTNGFAYLSNAGIPAPGLADYTATSAELASGPPRVAPMWNDLVITAALGGDVSIDNTSGTVCTITWRNAQSYGAGANDPMHTMQCKLYINGDVEFIYDPEVTNGSTQPTWWVAVTGVSPGMGATLPAASDFLVPGATGDVTVFEEWLTLGTFDLNNNSLFLVATTPGYVWVTNGPQANCASTVSYGIGCDSAPSSFYETFAAGALDLNGVTVTLLRQGSGYVALDSIPGTILPPSATALNIAMGMFDGEETVSLSAPMPIAGGTTSSLTITTKALIALSANSFGPVDWTPTSAEFLAFPDVVITPMWHDFNQAAAGSGLIWFEEIGGIAYATWDGVGVATPHRFQVQFEIVTGNITIVYDTSGNDGLDYLAGFKGPGALQDPGATDLSVELTTTITLLDTATVPLTLVSSLPLIGGVWDLTTNNIDAVSPISITFFSSTALNPGVTLPSLGIDAPGCSAYVNTLLTSSSATSAAGTSLVSVPLPNNAALVGFSLWAQSICLTLANNANIKTSNGVEVVVGY
jgi:hypothetical protein